ncbi:MAG: PHP domain-containing protein, partial [Erysipelotrichaceae bacterium]|nr:PHP domain-containing protein [Erysipelotrichaceae bacterium]
MATQLLVRSAYSLLSSMCTIEGIISKCKELGYKSVGLVDKNVLMGAMEFTKKCKSAEIKPIFGLEFDLKLEERTYPCILYAKDNEGFQNLMGLSSRLNSQGLDHIGIEELNVYKKHNILVLLSDDCPLTIAVDKNSGIDECIDYMKNYFGEFLVGLVDHDKAINVSRDIKIKEALNAHNIKTIALSRTFYLNNDDAYEYEILKCIKDKRVLEKDATLETGRHFLSKDEFSSMFNDDDIKNTDVLASLCNVDIDYKTELPKYDAPNGVSSKDYLVSLAKAGLQRRLHNVVTKEYASRLDYELSVILKMHFEDYFLIVYDFILYAKKNGIMVGPGRGSAGGSLVAYCLGITDIDPIKYGLLFERFLNPERISMPDIDTDFPDDRRDEVFEYVKNKYGLDHVAHIITYGTLKTKQVLRDVGRVLNYNARELDSITKPIPVYPHITLDQAMLEIPIFKQKIESEKKYRDLFNISKK